MANNFQEIEWQFEVDNLHRVRLLLAEFIKTLPYKASFKKRVSHIDTYFDAEDFTYFHAGFSMRIRKQGRIYEACLKSLADFRAQGLVRPQARLEISHRLPGLSPRHLLNVKGELGKRLRKKNPKVGIKPLFILSTEREKIILSTGKEAFAEIALDTTTQRDDPHQSHPLHLLRMEVEIIQPTFMITVEDIVKRLTKFLKNHESPIKPANTAKFMAAMSHNEIVPHGLDFGALHFTKKMFLDHYAVNLCKKYLEAAFNQEAGCRLSDDVEFIHHMRVALRKTLTVFKILFDYVPPKLMSFRPFLKSVIKALGPVRDLDVHMNALQSDNELATCGNPVELHVLITHLRKMRADAHEELLNLFNSKTYSRMVRKLFATLNNPQTLYQETAKTADVYPALIKNIMRKFSKMGAHLHIDSSTGSFHRLRIKGKELRYTLEFFETLSSKLLGNLIEIMTGIQNSLGELNDNRIAQDRLIAMARRHGKQFSPKLLFVMGQACMQHRAKEMSNRASFLDEFAKLPWAKMAV